ncbi:MAG TPA: hypothetical protein VJL29_15640 [Thermoguttaceae bacterium]|nr:hypothetical protein [Thermoguttaceae bacterium]
MNASPSAADGGNPFSTRYVRPGAIPYLFPPGENVSSVVGRLAANGWRGQIVGPHGAGKSTLLAAMLPAIEATGRLVVLVELHDGERRLPELKKETFYFFEKVECPLFSRVLVIDGYEQLPWWRRWCLKRQCRRRGMGLLVTSHHSVGLPLVFRVEVDAESARRVVAKLLAGRPIILTEQDVDRSLARHGRNLRETLFELYDLFEQRSK